MDDYKELNGIFLNRNIVTRFKTIPNKCNLEIGKKNYKYTAVNVFNKLPIYLRTLNCNKVQRKYIIKNWVRSHLN